MTGAKHHNITLSGLANVLLPHGLDHIIHGNHIAEIQALTAFERQDIEQDTPSKEGFDVFYAQLFQAIRAAHLRLSKAVVIANLVADFGADVAEAVKLRANLA